MSWSYRRVLVVLTAVAALESAACLSFAFGQKGPVVILPALPPQQPSTGSAEIASFDLPKDTTAHRRIEAAHDYIEARRWEEVVKVLQDILDDPQDKFAPLPRKGQDGKEEIVPTSVRAEANRLLATLPKEGLEAYKLYKDAGPRADEYLKKAHDAETVDDRLALLGLVVRKYLHTDAGADAADQLATHYMDLGDFRTAGRFYSLLLTRAGGADNLTPEMLFRAAYAFNQAGDKTDEDLIWQTARARGIREIHFGEETKSVADLQDYLGTLCHTVDGVSRQWAYFLGDASHTGKGDAGPAFMGRNWNQPTNVSYFPGDTTAAQDMRTQIGNKITALLDSAARQLGKVNQPVIPSQFPVTATIMGKDGQKMPLVVFMTHAGIAAADLRFGKLRGRTPIKGTLDWMLQDVGREGQLNQWTQDYLGVPDQQPGQRPGLLFENTTIGSLSTDGQFAYAVEDLAVPPPPRFRVNMGAFPPGAVPNLYGSDDLLKAVNRSRLLAFDLANGCKTAWETPDLDDKSDLADSCFLGPPLAVNGKLYVLAEKQQELRLICLETVTGEQRGTWKPKVDFVLPLGTARDSNLHGDVLRRVNAGHLSCGEGVLVCPTNLGYVIAIDLLQNSLLWAYAYRDKNDAPEETNGVNPIGPRRIIGGLVVGGYPVPTPQQGWKVSAPIIQDGKVVFTAPDSKSIHCVNLKDGTCAWKRPRQDTDVYLGGVVNGKAIVVGHGFVHAYNLADGEEPWKVETGMPSGFGAASGNTYYVPLKEAVGNKEPEICAIDVDRGVVTGHSKSRSTDAADKKPEAPGNLVFFEGAILSQTDEEIVAYPQIEVKKALATAALKNNPDDVDGLFDRGELSLMEGGLELEPAVQDFLHVLKNNPPAELQGKARAKLYEALTEYFQRDFDQAEKYQNDYQALCARDLPAGATDQEHAEARKRWTNYLYLIAKGKEGQRKLTEAFDKYLELNAQAQPDELLSLVDERLVKAAPDVLAQGRIAAMVASATEEERKPLEARIAARWKEIQSKNDLGELRKFVTLFGSLFSVGQEARLQLAEQLMDDDKEPEALIDAERQLSLLRAHARDPELAARAVECLARLNTRKGLLEDAAYYYRVLRDRYPTVKVRDGKTGADLFDEMATDKRLWSHLDEPPSFGASGKLKATEERDSFQYVKQAYKFSQVGEPLPFFQRYSLALEFANHELLLTDRTTGEARWKPLPITRTMFQTIVTYNNQPVGYNPGGFPGVQQGATQPPPTPKFSFMSLGHLVVLPVGHMVFGVDAVNGKVLWEKNLFNPVNGPALVSVGSGPPVFNSLTVDPRDGSVQVVYPNEWMQRLGQTGPLEGAAVCLQMKDALTAIDPVTGRVLWTRSDVGPHSHIFGDDQHIFVVEMSQDNKPSFTRVLRAYDGASVRGTPDFREVYENRIRLRGRDILVADKDKDATTLRLYDPLTGKDLWKQAFAPRSYVLQAEDGDLAGVVEPDGLVRVVDLATRKEVLSASSKMDPKYLEKEAVLSVLGDAADVYVACNGPMANTRVTTNLMPGTGLRGLNVNGELYAFRRETGKVHWHLPAPNTQLLLDRFQEMPMLVLTAAVAKNQGPFVGAPQAQSVTLTILEKRTGKMLLSYGPPPPGDPNHDASKDSYPGGPFHALEVDARNGTIELTSPQEKISIALESDRPFAVPTP